MKWTQSKKGFTIVPTRYDIIIYYLQEYMHYK